MDSLPTKQKQDESTTVIEEVRNLLASSSKSTVEKADAIREEAVQTLDKLLKKTNEVQAKAHQFSTASIHSADQYVKANPWRMIGATAGISLLIGFLSAHRKRR